MPASRTWTYSLPAALLLMAPFDLLASLGMDVYLPVVPRMPAILDTTPAVVQLTLSLYLVVLGCGQLLFGPLCDRIGRRPVLLGGGLLFIATSAGLALATWAPAFVALRVLQAAGAAATLVATFATVRDVYAQRPESVVIYGLLGSILAFVPAIGPVLGAVIDHGLGWRGIFLTLALLGAAAGLQASWRWPETRPTGTRPRLARVGAILRHAPFWTYTVGFSAAMGAFFVYFSTAPRLLIDRGGLSTLTFSLLFATVAVVMIIVSRFSGRLARRWGERGCLVRGMALLLAGAVLLASGHVVGIPATWALIAPMWIVAAGITVTCAVTANGALRAFGDVAGTAVALHYCIEGVIVSSAGTLAVLWLPADTVWPIAVFCAVAATLTLLLVRWLPR
ncbi:CmlA/FloR family chloramphenicol efflux MFS transporter [Reyranella sp. CPCC 100927]|uniref:CmlA/FloR family chloramphenicol efflux MFS transporter n=1 Tax=Reyranella sp. CPCC 100927 TaxID=2599616 RepID=UPI0011B502F0|nr:CmlA/FloR family chloramphenicol efflux MFS transporter [Reyranella sp. CPCC 100927]TWT11434.1 CmlA/FloR family chloramphenicol efflux MFS transporter [Reyranella sp. CPCC 100927]